MLGDGVISLILSNNLHLNGFQVTVYHDYLLAFQDWLEFNIKPTDSETLNEAILQTYDIVLADTYSTFTERYDKKQITELAKTIIFFSSGKLDDIYYHDHKPYLTNKLTGDKAIYIPNFSAAAKRLKQSPSHSMVDNMTLYCSETLKLHNVTSDTGLALPDELIFKKNPRRIIIAPTSSERKKEWSTRKFIQLARKLKNSGFNPVFSCTPDERKQWLENTKNEYELPEFISIKSFAEYIYESGLLIGNDSGSGHLAAALGIPVLTIVTSPRKRKFRWRPGWGNNSTIAPYFTFSLSGKRHWRLFLPVNKVFNAFIKMYKQNHSSVKVQ